MMLMYVPVLLPCVILRINLHIKGRYILDDSASTAVIECNQVMFSFDREKARGSTIASSIVTATKLARIGLLKSLGMYPWRFSRR
jgi:hypothetical protein